MGHMALSVPSDRRLREAELEALVVAVRDGAPDEPERDALEWKGALDVASNKGRFELARQILGFGNRDVALASRTFGGYAYLLVGVEPDGLPGVDMPDPAELNNALARFIAEGHPHWHPERVEVDGRTVLVIEVAPPRTGDRICTLQREFDGARPGRIFVRRPGQTIEASPSVVRALEDRYAAAVVEAQAAGNRLAEESLALERRRDAREQRQDAERRAPDFLPGRLRTAFTYTAPDLIEGSVRNAGAATAVVTEVLMYHPNGMVRGGLGVLSGPTSTSEPCVEATVRHGEELLMRFRHGALQCLQGSGHQLGLQLAFRDDAGFVWRQALVLLRRSKDVQDRELWVVQAEGSERHLEAAPSEPAANGG
jgi:hypothetical protein